MEASAKKAEVWRVPLHPGRTSKDDVLGGDALRARLKSIVKDHEKLHARSKHQVVVGIQGVSLVTGYLELPPLKEEELELAVRSSVAREVPFPVASLEVSHVPVAPITHGKQAVFYSAWKKVTSERLRSLCAHCGLTVVRTESTGVALTRELYRNRALDPTHFYVILNIGFELSQVVVVRGGYPYYLRDIPLGGRQIAHSVQSGGQVSWQEAEKLMSELPLFELVNLAGPVLSELVYEVTRSLNYFSRQFEHEGFDCVFLSGGCSMLQELPDWLEEELRMPVRAESWSQFKSNSEDAGLHKVAVGLALGQ